MMKSMLQRRRLQPLCDDINGAARQTRFAGHTAGSPFVRERQRTSVRRVTIFPFFSCANASHLTAHKKRAVQVGRPKSREETPKEGYGMPSEAQRCRTAKYQLRFPERKVQKLQSCHYGAEERFGSIMASEKPVPQDIGAKKRPFERANGPSLGRKRPYWAAVAKKCFRETACFLCACSPQAATSGIFCVRVYSEYDA